MPQDVATERFSLKDHLFNRESVTRLADMFGSAAGDFRRDEFVETVMTGLAPLQLKQRITFISEVLSSFLPNDFEKSVNLILASLPTPLDSTLEDDDFGDFIIAPLGEFVAAGGLAPGHFKISMAALKEITKRFSMEGPIRSFIDAYPEPTLAMLGDWADDENYHVRRLVSEGTRPLLPWAPRIGLDPADTIPLLDRLHADPTRYVTRSVANHLNDIAKANPDLVIDVLRRWHQYGLQEKGELKWMTRHALRTLVKQGNPVAMELMGFSAEPDVTVGAITIVPEDTLRIGDSLRFEVGVTAHSDERLIVDYVIDFVKKDGSTRPKVFRLKQLTMSSGEIRVLKKSHRMPANATTFTLYPGTHRLSLQVNGNMLSTAEFLLGPGR